MRLSELCSRFDDRLQVADFAGIDASANGLQVGRGAEVEHAAFAVDAAVETIQAAADAGADVLCVHHGVSWGGIDRVTGRAYGRIAPLIEHGLALYAAHLPLDAHPDLGNAAGLADVLGLADCEPFGALEGEHVGRRGRVADEPFTADYLEARLEAELDTGGRDVHTLDFGPEAIEDVAIVTGAGADWLDEAIETGADALVTGEGKHRLYHAAREAGINVFLAGHYATETFGVEALRSLAAEWGLDTSFVDRPTGL